MSQFDWTDDSLSVAFTANQSIPAGAVRSAFDWIRVVTQRPTLSVEKSFSLKAPPGSFSCCLNTKTNRLPAGTMQKSLTFKS